MVPLSTPPLPLPDHGFQAPAVPDTQRDLLNRLRLVGMGCRVAAHTDLFEACALLSLDGEDAKRTYLGTFVKCLSDAVCKRIIWFSPGSREMSFDEAWIMRCLTSIQQKDTASLDFLLRSRVTPADRRYIGFLMARVSEKFSQV
ncbi:hypothetical protein ROLI_020140 [Roseobacter fucihabitans]|uniref:Uncharacterized protein n=1 Tax=Roseobacter fucihabitans TaxID=1537242 RepID=A0ABZ2BTX5_9RHOB|nr:hypothetical protein [Roseobacter litoralis]MBC6966570.1 hypothetical protein [Roseobacter litoralis]